MLSDRVKRWLLERLERGLGEYAEGQAPPLRLREAVVSFANEHPKATRGEWIDFAAHFAEECYGAGYIRGVEWAERDPAAEGTGTLFSPEEIADQIDPSWRDRPWDPKLFEGAGGDAVPEARSPEQVLRDQVWRMKPRPRRF